MHKLVSKMTIEEKASLMSGGNFWNTKALPHYDIEAIMMTDGPHGLRKQGGKADHLGLHKSLPATCFPTAATLANSWDTTLLKQVGSALGVEAASEKVSILLGPGMNIKRNPLGGRNFEYFSEDPHLTADLSVAMIQGIQSKGVAACAKHFAVNSQELHRMSVDEIVDDRALHEIYLKSFKRSVTEANVQSIMTAYNKVNGTFANENQLLLQDILRNSWQFKGLVVTDWGGNNDRVDALKVGNHLEMPATNGMTDLDIVKAIEEGSLSEEILDERVSEYLNFYEKIKEQETEQHCDYDEHHQLAIHAARESIVLLKNENSVLPLREDEKILLVGDFAQKPRYQGAGSSLINPTQIESLKDSFETNGINFTFTKGYHRYGKQDMRLIKKALRASESADKIVVFLGLDESSESEGVDRDHMDLPLNQITLIDALISSQKPIVVVLAGGAPVTLPFLDKISGLVHGYLPGQGGSEAIYDVLYGRHNPSGKLAETYPINYEDVVNKNYYPGLENTAEHRESIFIGYRYFDTYNKEVRFPFGFGLSYTNFSYNSIKKEDNIITVNISNIGACDGSEIIQLYIGMENSVLPRPSKELKQFKKVKIKKGESVNVSFELNEEDFEVYDPIKKSWITEAGVYNIMVGSSSATLPLRTTLSRKGLKLDEDRYICYKKYFYQDLQKLSSQDFQSIINYKLPSEKWDRTEKLNYNSMIKETQFHSRFGKFINHIIELLSALFMKLGKPNASNNVIFAQNLPLRGVARMSAGKVDMAMLDGLITMFEGHFFKGIGQFIKAWFRKIGGNKNER